LISAHLLPEAAFTALAAGGGGSAVVCQLRQAQRSKHTMLLHAVAEAAGHADPASSATAAFRAGYELLAGIQAKDPPVSEWLLSLPHVGSWLHDCLIRLERAAVPDFAYFACAATAAAVRAGIAFDINVPVRGGQVLLPGLGSLNVATQSRWARLHCDGERLTAVGQLQAYTNDLRPDDGSGTSPPQWRGTPAIRCVADGLTWDVLLVTDDPYLDRYTLPMSTGLSADELRLWRQGVKSAWDLLVRHHRWAAGPIADGVSAIVPLTPQSDTDLISATSPAAFGAIATSWPPDPVTMAETFVHEFQHVKLCGLVDMVPLTESCAQKVYAPWRQDPRPVSGLLQGVYAHLGIVRFWQAQRHAETDPDDILRAQVQFARWRPAIDTAVNALLQAGSLTPAGARFADLLQAQGRELASEPVPTDAQEIAREVALDHWLTWQMRHMAPDAAGVANLATAYRQGESFPERAQPEVSIHEDIRKVDSGIRSRLLNMRYLAPGRYRELCADGVLPLSEPDRLLLKRSADAAVQAYRDLITTSADSRPDAWVGLALALHQLPAPWLQAATATHLPVMFEVHSRLGAQSDPLELATWFE
jgi:HEXXH motif-containing protein